MTNNNTLKELIKFKTGNDDAYKVISKHKNTFVDLKEHKSFNDIERAANNLSIEHAKSIKAIMDSINVNVETVSAIKCFDDMDHNNCSDYFSIVLNDGSLYDFAWSTV